MALFGNKAALQGGDASSAGTKGITMIRVATFDERLMESLARRPKRMLRIACFLAISISVPLHGANAGTGFKVLHTFADGDDGAFPEATLLVDSGKVYGTAESGGTSSKGVVFEMTPNGAETVLYDFTGG